MSLPAFWDCSLDNSRKNSLAGRMELWLVEVREVEDGWTGVTEKDLTFYCLLAVECPEEGVLDRPGNNERNGEQMGGLRFVNYERGEWEIVTIEGDHMQVSRRSHCLTMTWEDEAPPLKLFAVSGKVNADEFLDLPPGFLLCDRVVVRASIPGKVPDFLPNRMLDMTESQVLLLSYVFLEQTPWGWNDLPHGTGGNKAEIKTHRVFPTTALVPLFGQKTFDPTGVFRFEPDPVPLRMDETGTIRVGLSRVTLDVLLADYKQGLHPDQIARELDTLTQADVYGSLAYYQRHRGELDEYLRLRREVADQRQQTIELSQAPRQAELQARLDAFRARRDAGHATPAE
jgi:uncharacterized protein (DUF433 family)